jgi:hypothetical protein
MRVRNLCAAALAWLCLGSQVQAGEIEMRAAMKTEMGAAFARGDYQAIEARYAAAMKKAERTSSGLFVTDLIRASVVPNPTGASSVPGRDDHWLPVERKLDAWAKQFPQSSLVAIAQSWAYIGHAWSWRGSGYGRTVTPEGFRQVDAYAARAYDALMARQNVGRQDANWYAQLLAVARIQGWPAESHAALVNEATRAFPLSPDIYFAAASKLQPRWGGSAQAIAKFAAFAVERTRKEEGESMYARIYWAMGEGVDAELWGPEVDWKRIRAGFDDLVKRYPDSWNLNHFARMACEAGDMPTARRVLQRVKDDVEQTAWPDRAAYLRCLEAAGLKRETMK